MLDRSKSPVSLQSTPFSCPKPSFYDIHPHLKLLVVEDNQKDVVQMSFSAPTGLLDDRRSYTSAQFLMSMLTEGTETRDKKAITDLLAKCGASLWGCMKGDLFSLQLTTTPKFFFDLLPLFAEVLEKPSLTAEAVERLKKAMQQGLSIQKKNPSHLANEKINTLLFGENHPYSHHMEKEDIASFEVSQIKTFYQERGWYPGVVALSGKVDTKMIEAVQKALSSLPYREKPSFDFPAFKPSKEKRSLITKEGPQSTLALEMTTIGHTHPDYQYFYILNYLLGAPYLGSRLMQNVREKQGNTYGIHSWIYPYFHATVLGINAQVKKGFAEETYEAIGSEIKRLQEELIPAKELQTLKENLKGTLKTWCDNKGVLAGTFVSAYFLNVGFDRMDEMYKKLEGLTPETLQRVAKEQLDMEKFYCVIVNK